MIVSEKQKTKPIDYTYQLVWLRNIIVFLSVPPIWVFTLWLSAYFRGIDGFVYSVTVLFLCVVYMIIDAILYDLGNTHIHSGILKALRPKNSGDDNG